MRRRWRPRIVASQVGGLLIGASVLGPLRLTGTTASLTDCQVTSASLDTGAVVRLGGSRLDITDGSVSMRLSLGGAGFQLTDSDLELRFVHGLTLTKSFFPGGPPTVDFDIGASSRVTQHAYVIPENPTVIGGPFFRSTAGTSLRAMPAGPGGTISIDLVNVRSQGSVWVFLSSAVTPYDLPGLDGTLFVGGGPLMLNLGSFSMAPGLVNVPVNVPSNPVFQGFPVVVQGLTSSFEVTNAHGFTLR